MAGNGGILIATMAPLAFRMETWNVSEIRKSESQLPIVYIHKSHTGPS